MRRRFIEESSASIWASGLLAAPRAGTPAWAGREAPYPAWTTAWMMLSGARAASSYSTFMELVIRLTSALRTPSSLFTAFSTWAEHAEQVIPVTSNFCFKGNTSFQRRGSAHGAQRPAAEAAQIRSGANAIHPPGVGYLQHSAGEEVCQGLSWRFFEILCRRAPALREAEQGLSKFKIEGKRRLLIADGIKPVYVKRDCFLYGIRWEG